MGDCGAVRSSWLMPDTCSSLCFDCGIRFSTFIRRHHCFQCGLVFCCRCCPTVVNATAAQSQKGTPTRVRLCQACVELNYAHGLSALQQHQRQLSRKQEQQQRRKVGEIGHESQYSMEHHGTRRQTLAVAGTSQQLHTCDGTCLRCEEGSLASGATPLRVSSLAHVGEISPKGEAAAAPGAAPAATASEDSHRLLRLGSAAHTHSTPVHTRIPGANARIPVLYEQQTQNKETEPPKGGRSVHPQDCCLSGEYQMSAAFAGSRNSSKITSPLRGLCTETSSGASNGTTGVQPPRKAASSCFCDSSTIARGALNICQFACEAAPAKTGLLLHAAKSTAGSLVPPSDIVPGPANTSISGKAAGGDLPVTLAGEKEKNVTSNGVSFVAQSSSCSADAVTVASAASACVDEGLSHGIPAHTAESQCLRWDARAAEGQQKESLRHCPEEPQQTHCQQQHQHKQLQSQRQQRSQQQQHQLPPQEVEKDEELKEPYGKKRALLCTSFLSTQLLEDRNLTPSPFDRSASFDTSYSPSRDTSCSMCGANPLPVKTALSNACVSTALHSHAPSLRSARVLSASALHDIGANIALPSLSPTPVVASGADAADASAADAATTTRPLFSYAAPRASLPAVKRLQWSHASTAERAGNHYLYCTSCQAFNARGNSLRTLPGLTSANPSESAAAKTAAARTPSHSSASGDAARAVHVVSAAADARSLPLLLPLGSAAEKASRLLLDSVRLHCKLVGLSPSVHAEVLFLLAVAVVRHLRLPARPLHQDVICAAGSRWLSHAAAALPSSEQTRSASLFSSSYEVSPTSRLSSSAVAATAGFYRLFDCIKIKRIPGGHITDSFYVHGVVFPIAVMQKYMYQLRLHRPRIVLLSFYLGLTRDRPNTLHPPHTAAAGKLRSCVAQHAKTSGTNPPSCSTGPNDTFSGGHSRPLSLRQVVAKASSRLMGLLRSAVSSTQLSLYYDAAAPVASLPYAVTSASSSLPRRPATTRSSSGLSSRVHSGERRRKKTLAATTSTSERDTKWRTTLEGVEGPSQRLRTALPMAGTAFCANAPTIQGRLCASGKAEEYVNATTDMCLHHRDKKRSHEGARLVPLQLLREQEAKHTDILISKIRVLQPDLIISSCDASFMLQQQLIENRIAFLPNVRMGTLRRISRCTGAPILPSLDLAAATVAEGAFTAGACSSSFDVRAVDSPHAAAAAVHINGTATHRKAVKASATQTAYKASPKGIDSCVGPLSSRASTFPVSPKWQGGRPPWGFCELFFLCPPTSASADVSTGRQIASSSRDVPSTIIDNEATPTRMRSTDRAFASELHPLSCCVECKREALRGTSAKEGSQNFSYPDTAMPRAPGSRSLALAFLVGCPPSRGATICLRGAGLVGPTDGSSSMQAPFEATHVSGIRSNTQDRMTEQHQLLRDQQHAHVRQQQRQTALEHRSKQTQSQPLQRLQLRPVRESSTRVTATAPATGDGRLLDGPDELLLAKRVLRRGLLVSLSLQQELRFVGSSCSSLVLHQSHSQKRCAAVLAYATDSSAAAASSRTFTYEAVDGCAAAAGTPHDAADGAVAVGVAKPQKPAVTISAYQPGNECGTVSMKTSSAGLSHCHVQQASRVEGRAFFGSRAFCWRGRACVCHQKYGHVSSTRGDERKGAWSYNTPPNGLCCSCVCSLRQQCCSMSQTTCICCCHFIHRPLRSSADAPRPALDELAARGFSSLPRTDVFDARAVDGGTTASAVLAADEGCAAAFAKDNCMLSPSPSSHGDLSPQQRMNIPCPPTASFSGAAFPCAAPAYSPELALQALLKETYMQVNLRVWVQSALSSTTVQPPVLLLAYYLLSSAFPADVVRPAVKTRPFEAAPTAANYLTSGIASTAAHSSDSSCYCAPPQEPAVQQLSQQPARQAQQRSRPDQPSKLQEEDELQLTRSPRMRDHLVFSSPTQQQRPVPRGITVEKPRSSSTGGHEVDSLSTAVMTSHHNKDKGAGAPSSAKSCDSYAPDYREIDQPQPAEERFCRIRQLVGYLTAVEDILNGGNVLHRRAKTTVTEGVLFSNSRSPKIEAGMLKDAAVSVHHPTSSAVGRNLHLASHLLGSKSRTSSRVPAATGTGEGASSGVEAAGPSVAAAAAMAASAAIAAVAGTRSRAASGLSGIQRSATAGRATSLCTGSELLEAAAAALAGRFEAAAAAAQVATGNRRSYSWVGGAWPLALRRSRSPDGLWAEVRTAERTAAVAATPPCGSLCPLATSASYAASGVSRDTGFCACTAAGVSRGGGLEASSRNCQTAAASQAPPSTNKSYRSVVPAQVNLEGAAGELPMYVRRQLQALLPQLLVGLYRLPAQRLRLLSSWSYNKQQCDATPQHHDILLLQQPTHDSEVMHLPSVEELAFAYSNTRTKTFPVFPYSPAPQDDPLDTCVSSQSGHRKDSCSKRSNNACDHTSGAGRPTVSWFQPQRDHTSEIEKEKIPPRQCSYDQDPPILGACSSSSASTAGPVATSATNAGAFFFPCVSTFSTMTMESLRDAVRLRCAAAAALTSSRRCPAGSARCRGSFFEHSLRLESLEARVVVSFSLLKYIHVWRENVPWSSAMHLQCVQLQVEDRGQFLAAGVKAGGRTGKSTTQERYKAGSESVTAHGNCCRVRCGDATPRVVELLCEDEGGDVAYEDTIADDGNAQAYNREDDVTEDVIVRQYCSSCRRFVVPWKRLGAAGDILFSKFLELMLTNDFYRGQVTDEDNSGEYCNASCRRTPRSGITAAVPQAPPEKGRGCCLEYTSCTADNCAADVAPAHGYAAASPSGTSATANVWTDKLSWDSVVSFKHTAVLPPLKKIRDPHAGVKSRLFGDSCGAEHCEKAFTVSCAGADSSVGGRTASVSCAGNHVAAAVPLRDDTGVACCRRGRLPGSGHSSGESALSERSHRCSTTESHSSYRSCNSMKNGLSTPRSSVDCLSSNSSSTHVCDRRTGINYCRRTNGKRRSKRIEGTDGPYTIRTLRSPVRAWGERAAPTGHVGYEGNAPAVSRKAVHRVRCRTGTAANHCKRTTMVAEKGAHIAAAVSIGAGASVVTREDLPNVTGDFMHQNPHVPTPSASGLAEAHDKLDEQNHRGKIGVHVITDAPSDTTTTVPNNVSAAAGATTCSAENTEHSACCDKNPVLQWASDERLAHAKNSATLIVEDYFLKACLQQPKEADPTVFANDNSACRASLVPAVTAGQQCNGARQLQPKVLLQQQQRGLLREYGGHPMHKQPGKKQVQRQQYTVEIKHATEKQVPLEGQYMLRNRNKQKEARSTRPVSPTVEAVGLSQRAVPSSISSEDTLEDGRWRELRTGGRRRRDSSPGSRGRGDHVAPRTASVHPPCSQRTRASALVCKRGLVAVEDPKATTNIFSSCLYDRKSLQACQCLEHSSAAAAEWHDDWERREARKKGGEMYTDARGLVGADTRRPQHAIYQDNKLHSRTERDTNGRNADTRKITPGKSTGNYINAEVEAGTFCKHLLFRDRIFYFAYAGVVMSFRREPVHIYRLHLQEQRAATSAERRIAPSGPHPLAGMREAAARGKVLLDQSGDVEPLMDASVRDNCLAEVSRACSSCSCETSGNDRTIVPTFERRLMPEGHAADAREKEVAVGLCRGKEEDTYVGKARNLRKLQRGAEDDENTPHRRRLEKQHLDLKKFPREPASADARNSDAVATENWSSQVSVDPGKKQHQQQDSPQRGYEHSVQAEQERLRDVRLGSWKAPLRRQEDVHYLEQLLEEERQKQQRETGPIELDECPLRLGGLVNGGTKHDYREYELRESQLFELVGRAFPCSSVGSLVCRGGQLGRPGPSYSKAAMRQPLSYRPAEAAPDRNTANSKRMQQRCTALSESCTSSYDAAEPLSNISSDDDRQSALGEPERHGTRKPERFCVNAVSSEDANGLLPLMSGLVGLLLDAVLLPQLPLAVTAASPSMSVALDDASMPRQCRHDSARHSQCTVERSAASQEPAQQAEEGDAAFDAPKRWLPVSSEGSFIACEHGCSSETSKAGGGSALRVFCWKTRGPQLFRTAATEGRNLSHISETARQAYGGRAVGQLSKAVQPLKTPAIYAHGLRCYGGYRPCVADAAACVLACAQTLLSACEGFMNRWGSEYLNFVSCGCSLCAPSRRYQGSGRSPHRSCACSGLALEAEQMHPPHKWKQGHSLIEMCEHSKELRRENKRKRIEKEDATHASVSCRIRPDPPVVLPLTATSPSCVLELLNWLLRLSSLRPTQRYALRCARHIAEAAARGEISIQADHECSPSAPTGGKQRVDALRERRRVSRHIVTTVAGCRRLLSFAKGIFSTLESVLHDLAAFFFFLFIFAVERCGSGVSPFPRQSLIQGRRCTRSACASGSAAAVHDNATKRKRAASAIAHVGAQSSAHAAARYRAGAGNGEEKPPAWPSFPTCRNVSGSVFSPVSTNTRRSLHSAWREEVLKDNPQKWLRTAQSFVLLQRRLVAHRRLLCERAVALLLFYCCRGVNPGSCCALGQTGCSRSTTGAGSYGRKRDRTLTGKRRTYVEEDSQGILAAGATAKAGSASSGIRMSAAVASPWATRGRTIRAGLERLGARTCGSAAVYAAGMEGSSSWRSVTQWGRGGNPVDSANSISMGGAATHAASLNRRVCSSARNRTECSVWGDVGREGANYRLSHSQHSNVEYRDCSAVLQAGIWRILKHGILRACIAVETELLFVWTATQKLQERATVLQQQAQRRTVHKEDGGKITHAQLVLATLCKRESESDAVAGAGLRCVDGQSRRRLAGDSFRVNAGVLNAVCALRKRVLRSARQRLAREVRHPDYMLCGPTALRSKHISIAPTPTNAAPLIFGLLMLCRGMRLCSATRSRVTERLPARCSRPPGRWYFGISSTLRVSHLQFPFSWPRNLRLSAHWVEGVFWYNAARLFHCRSALACFALRDSPAFASALSPDLSSLMHDQEAVGRVCVTLRGIWTGCALPLKRCSRLNDLRSFPTVGKLQLRGAAVGHQVLLSRESDAPGPIHMQRLREPQSRLQSCVGQRATLLHQCSPPGRCCLDVFTSSDGLFLLGTSERRIRCSNSAVSCSLVIVRRDAVDAACAPGNACSGEAAVQGARGLQEATAALGPAGRTLQALRQNFCQSGSGRQHLLESQGRSASGLGFLWDTEMSLFLLCVPLALLLSLCFHPLDQKYLPILGASCSKRENNRVTGVSATGGESSSYKGAQACKAALLRRPLHTLWAKRRTPRTSTFSLFSNPPDYSTEAYLSHPKTVLQRQRPMPGIRSKETYPSEHLRRRLFSRKFGSIQKEAMGRRHRFMPGQHTCTMEKHRSVSETVSTQRRADQSPQQLRLGAARLCACSGRGYRMLGNIYVVIKMLPQARSTAGATTPSLAISDGKCCGPRAVWCLTFPKKNRVATELPAGIRQFLHDRARREPVLRCSMKEGRKRRVGREREAETCCREGRGAGLDNSDHVRLPCDGHQFTFLNSARGFWGLCSCHRNRDVGGCRKRVQRRFTILSGRAAAGVHAKEANKGRGASKERQGAEHSIRARTLSQGTKKNIVIPRHTVRAQVLSRRSLASARDSQISSCRGEEEQQLDLMQQKPWQKATPARYQRQRQQARLPLRTALQELHEGRLQLRFEKSIGLRRERTLHRDIVCFDYALRHYKQEPTARVSDNTLLSASCENEDVRGTDSYMCRPCRFSMNCPAIQRRLALHVTAAARCVVNTVRTSLVSLAARHIETHPEDITAENHKTSSTMLLQQGPQSAAKQQPMPYKDFSDSCTARCLARTTEPPHCQRELSPDKNDRITGAASEDDPGSIVAYALSSASMRHHLEELWKLLPAYAWERSLLSKSGNARSTSLKITKSGTTVEHQRVSDTSVNGDIRTGRTPTFRSSFRSGGLHPHFEKFRLSMQYLIDGTAAAAQMPCKNAGTVVGASTSAGVGSEVHLEGKEPRGLEVFLCSCPLMLSSQPHRLADRGDASPACPVHSPRSQQLAEQRKSRGACRQCTVTSALQLLLLHIKQRQRAIFRPGSPRPQVIDSRRWIFSQVKNRLYEERRMFSCPQWHRTTCAVARKRYICERLTASVPRSRPRAGTACNAKSDFFDGQLLDSDRRNDSGLLHERRTADICRQNVPTRVKNMQKAKQAMRGYISEAGAQLTKERIAVVLSVFCYRCFLLGARLRLGCQGGYILSKPHSHEFFSVADCVPVKRCAFGNRISSRLSGGGVARDEEHQSRKVQVHNERPRNGMIGVEDAVGAPAVCGLTGPRANVTPTCWVAYSGGGGVDPLPPLLRMRVLPQHMTRKPADRLLRERSRSRGCRDARKTFYLRFQNVARGGRFGADVRPKDRRTCCGQTQFASEALRVLQRVRRNYSNAVKVKSHHSSSRQTSFSRIRSTAGRIGQVVAFTRELLLCQELFGVTAHSALPASTLPSTALDRHLSTLLHALQLPHEQRQWRHSTMKSYNWNRIEVENSCDGTSDGSRAISFSPSLAERVFNDGNVRPALQHSSPVLPPCQSAPQHRSLSGSRPGRMQMMRQEEQEENNFFSGNTLRVCRSGLDAVLTNINDGVKEEFISAAEHLDIIVPLRPRAARQTAGLNIGGTLCECVVTVYYALQFHIMRHLLCGNDDEFCRSLRQSSPVRLHGGKSGARFTITADSRYILKQLNRHEVRLLLSPRHGMAFFRHFAEVLFESKHTTLTCFYGMYQISSRPAGKELGNPRRQFYVVMRNLRHSDFYAGDTLWKSSTRFLHVVVMCSLMAILNKAESATSPPSGVQETQKLLIFDLKGLGMHRYINDIRSVYPSERWLERKSSRSDARTESEDVPMGTRAFAKVPTRTLEVQTQGGCVMWPTCSQVGSLRAPRKHTQSPADVVPLFAYRNVATKPPRTVATVSEGEYEQGEHTDPVTSILPRKAPTDAAEKSVLVRSPAVDQRREQQRRDTCRTNGRLYREQAGPAADVPESDGATVHTVSMHQPNYPGLQKCECTSRADRQCNAELVPCRSGTCTAGEGAQKLFVSRSGRVPACPLADELALRRAAVRSLGRCGRGIVPWPWPSVRRKSLARRNGSTLVVARRRSAGEELTPMSPAEARPTVGRTPDALFANTLHPGSCHFSGEDSRVLPVLWDQNFREYGRGFPLCMEARDHLRFLAALEDDTMLLQQLDVVDYSLLVLIDEGANVVSRSHQLAVGLIDFFRPYTWDKQVENIGKSLAYLTRGLRQRPTVLSPSDYRQRFLRAMKAFFGSAHPSDSSRLTWYLYFALTKSTAASAQDLDIYDALSTCSSFRILTDRHDVERVVTTCEMQCSACCPLPVTWSQGQTGLSPYELTTPQMPFCHHQAESTCARTKGPVVVPEYRSYPAKRALSSYMPRKLDAGISGGAGEREDCTKLYAEDTSLKPVVSSPVTYYPFEGRETRWFAETGRGTMRPRIKEAHSTNTCRPAVCSRWTPVGSMEATQGLASQEITDSASAEGKWRGVVSKRKPYVILRLPGAGRRALHRATCVAVPHVTVPVAEVPLKQVVHSGRDTEVFHSDVGAWEAFVAARICLLGLRVSTQERSQEELF